MKKPLNTIGCYDDMKKHAKFQQNTLVKYAKKCMNQKRKETNINQDFIEKITICIWMFLQIVLQTTQAEDI